MLAATFVAENTAAKGVQPSSLPSLTSPYDHCPVAQVLCNEMQRDTMDVRPDFTAAYLVTYCLLAPPTHLCTNSEAVLCVQSAHPHTPVYR